MSARNPSIVLRFSRSLTQARRTYATSSASGSGGATNPASYCSDLVKKYDPEAWLQHFFWPREVRDLWLGWRAFNVSLLGRAGVWCVVLIWMRYVVVGDSSGVECGETAYDRDDAVSILERRPQSDLECRHRQIVADETC